MNEHRPELVQLAPSWQVTSTATYSLRPWYELPQGHPLPLEPMRWTCSYCSRSNAPKNEDCLSCGAPRGAW